MPGYVKAILPPKFDKKAVLDVLKNEMDKYGPFLEKSFERTTQGWSGTKPKFKAVKVTALPKQIRLEVRVLGQKEGRQKWHWLDKGTKPHDIFPKLAKRLKFRTGYSAGSKPGSTFTVSGRAYGETVYSNGVHHPGTKARGWTALIIEEHKNPFERWMRASMYAAARASGHGKK